MTMPRHKQPIYAAGYYRPRRSQPVHFLPPMKMKLKDTTTMAKKVDETPSQSATTRSHYTRNDASRRIRRGRYTKMITTLKRSLTVENVSDMTFLCKDYVQPPHLLDSIRYPRDLIALLEAQRLLAGNSLYFLQTLLYYISRLDLYELVLNFRAAKQQDYKDRGIDIKAVYDIRSDSLKRAPLMQEVLRFRQDLKPRSRFHKADVNGLKNKLIALTTKMKHNVLDMHRTAHMRQLYDGNLRAIVGNEDVQPEEKKDVKLRLYHSDELTNHKVVSEQKVKRKSRMPLTKPSIEKTTVSRITQSPAENELMHVVNPNATFEQNDGRLRLTQFKEHQTEPVPEKMFDFAAPIRPLSVSENLTDAENVVNTDEEGVMLELRQTLRTAKTSGHTTKSNDNCDHPTRADLDTQHLSDAIQKIQKKMGLNVKNSSSQSRDIYNEYIRCVPQKSKRRNKKDQQHLVNAAGASLKGKLKSRTKLAGKRVKRPNILDKNA